MGRSSEAIPVTDKYRQALHHVMSKPPKSGTSRVEKTVSGLQDAPIKSDRTRKHARRKTLESDKWAPKENTRAKTGKGVADRRPQEASDGGRSDDVIVFNIQKYLNKNYGIPVSQIELKCTIKFGPNGYELLGRQTREEISQIHALIHTPDVAVTDADGNLWFVIEQDGMIHETEEVIKKDEKRNQHYAKAGIQCIVLNTEKIRSIKMSRGEYLDVEMKKIGIMKLGQSQ